MSIYTTSNSTEHLPDGGAIEHGEHWSTRCGSAAIPQVASMIANTILQQPHIKTWSVVVSVGCPGNWVYGPNLKSLAISVEAAYSGLIVIASPSSFFIKPKASFQTAGSESSA